MTATLDEQDGATVATPDGRLDFEVIKSRAAKILGVSTEDVGDVALARLTGIPRETIWRFRHDARKPSFPAALAIAAKLGMTVDEITAKGNPSPPKPAGPSTPTPPSGPKPASPSKAA